MFLKHYSIWNNHSNDRKCNSAQIILMKTLAEVWEVWENRRWILRWPTETRTTGNYYLPGGGGGVFRSEPGESRAGPQMMRFPVAAVVSRGEAPAREMEPGKAGARKKHPNCLFSLSWISCCCFNQFSSVTQLCLTLCNPMDCSTPGFPVHHQLPELAQTHIRWVSDAILPSDPLSSPSPPAFNRCQRQGLFQRVSSLHQVAKVLEFQLQASVLPMGIQDWFPLGLAGWLSLQSKGLSRVFPNNTVQKHQFFSAQLSL